jgi:hypothetical protein
MKQTPTMRLSSGEGVLTRYRERGECRARDQHDVLVKSLDTVAKEAEGESTGWTVKLIIFVGGTCGSVHV